MAKVTRAVVSEKHKNAIPPVVETDIKRKIGRPRKDALTVEQEIIVLHNKISKLVSRVNAIEEMVLEVKDGQDKASTVKPKQVARVQQPVDQPLDADIAEIKEMLHQLLDSIGEEG